MNPAISLSTIALLALGACDPIWGVNVGIRDPGNQPIADATLAVACAEGTWGATQMAARTDPMGITRVGGLGNRFPIGCDVFVAKPGFRTHRIRYTEICPDGPDHCDRVFKFDLVLQPE
jgi:hypothetical protein